ncbi:MAG: class B sortase [Clostridia bacterium]|nr:class B sortase [Clostridia bacterium]
MGKKIIKLADSTVNCTVLVTFLLLFVFGVYALWDTQQITRLADASQYEEYKPQEDSLSFEELQRINPEVFGWLTVYGTNIDYPLVQAENDDKYINTNAEGNYSLSGSIFLSYQNKKDFTDFNSIIYGHHMEKHVMFGDIGNFKQENHFNKYKYGNIFYDGKEHGLEFFAFLEVDAYDGSIYAPPIKNDEDKKILLDNIREKATHYREIGNLGIEDHLVLLSTCTSESTNGRHILVGRITENTFQNSFGKESDTKQKWNIDGQSILKILKNIPIWVWILSGIILILSVLLRVLNTKKNATRNRKERGKNTDEKDANSKKD